MMAFSENTAVLLTCLLMAASSTRAVGETLGNARTFSTAIKGGTIEADKEQTLYEIDEGPGFFTEMWFAGALEKQNTTVVRIYIDGEETPSIEFNNLLGHGIGCNGSLEGDHTPWHTKHFGHEATGGGLYNTYRIPFGKSAKLTAQVTKTDHFWFLVHGLLGAPLVVDGVALPNNTRLKLYKQENVFLQPLEFLTIADVSNSSGWIYQVTLAANSSNFHYLEACFRVSIDGGENQFLSSGTEDFFLSAYYFDRQYYMADQSGLTCKANPGQMGAYKFFVADPILFTNSVSLKWRCGEGSAPAEEGNCPNKEAAYHQGRRHRRDDPDFWTSLEKPTLKNLSPSNTTATTYAWVYEY